MKKWVVMVFCTLLLTGCATQEVLETVADEMVESALAQVRQIRLELPEEAAAAVSESDAGTLYQCDGYEITVQTLNAGDLDATIRAVSGYSRDKLTVMESPEDSCRRYVFVWASVGEEGERIGRAVILDDGNYHYAVSVLADTDAAEQHRENWERILDSFALD